MSNSQCRRLLTLPLLIPPPIDPVTRGVAGLGLFTASVEEFQRYTRLHRARQRPRSSRPRPGGQRITELLLRRLPEEHCEWQFRCVQPIAQEFLRVVRQLEIPDTFTTPSRYRFTAIEAFALTLARFRSAGDIDHLTILYDRSHAAISEAVNFVVTFVDERWRHLLDFDNNTLLHPTRLQYYADCVHRAGSPLRGVWGFIDCTIRRIARPSHYQRVAYNGYKKYHALKYQAVMLPNGMFGHLHGPVEGRHNDLALLDHSCLMHMLEEKAVREGVPADAPASARFLQIFGDPAYGLNYHIVSPFMSEVPSEAECEWNEQMGSVRVEVEHGFGGVTRLWPFLDAHGKQKVYASPVGIYYRFGVLMTNIVNCLCPNQVSTTFDCVPPTLTEYLHH